MKKLVISAAVFSSFCICSCSDRIQRENAGIISDFNKRDSFYFDFPNDENGKVDSELYKMMKKEEALMDKSSMTEGVDSIRIRVYYGCILADKYWVEFSNENQEWSAEVCKINYEMKKNDSLDYAQTYDSISKDCYCIKPGSGWERFINKLFKAGMLTIKDQSVVIKKEDIIQPMDGCGIAIIIATKNAFRAYRYSNPDFYVDKYPEAKTVMNIVAMIEKELAIKNHRFKKPSYEIRKNTNTHFDIVPVELKQTNEPDSL